MKITEERLRNLIKEIAINEMGPKGAIRWDRSGRKKQYKIGKVEDENRELSATEVESMFPGAVDAWVEVGPEIYPDLVPDIGEFDPRDQRHMFVKESVFFLENGVLVVSGKAMPTFTLMRWDPQAEDWFEIN